MAEAVANHVGQGRITAFSAGSSPQSQVHPLSLHFLSEQGIDTQGLSSQSWHEFSELEPDAILTLCDSAAAEACPVWFDSSVQVHWGLSDPSGGELPEQDRAEKFEATIDILQRRIMAIMADDTSELRGEALHNKLNEIASQIH